MGSLQLAENYQMTDMHRALLQKARIYLLHNMRPTESLWSTFISKEVLSYDMIDEIKVGAKLREKPNHYGGGGCKRYEERQEACIYLLRV